MYEVSAKLHVGIYHKDRDNLCGLVVIEEHLHQNGNISKSECSYETKIVPCIASIYIIFFSRILGA